MLPKILARVTSRSVEGPRGPDVLHRVRVLREWLTAGAVLEIELPRNLACAACGGGGCDRCGRSGAITLRERDELSEVVEITLPARPSAVDAPLDAQGVTLRIPEQGGLPEPGSELPRGTLLLTLVPSETADARIQLSRSPGSRRVTASVDDAADGQSEVGARHRRRGPLVVAIVILALWILLLVWLRLSGRG